MDIGDVCDYCDERDCELCTYGNSCIGCEDYVIGKGCKSKGACAETKEETDDRT